MWCSGKSTLCYSADPGQVSAIFPHQGRTTFDSTQLKTLSESSPELNQYFLCHVMIMQCYLKSTLQLVSIDQHSCPHIPHSKHVWKCAMYASQILSNIYKTTFLFLTYDIKRILKNIKIQLKIFNHNIIYRFLNFERHEFRFLFHHQILIFIFPWNKFLNPCFIFISYFYNILKPKNSNLVICFWFLLGDLSSSISNFLFKT